MLGVVLGGGGLGALVLAATQLSARSRLRSNVRRNAEALKSVKADGRAAMVLQQAIDTDAMRLAAMSIRTASIVIRAYGVFLLGIVAIGLLWTWVLPLIGVPGPSELLGAQVPEGRAREEYLRETRSALTGGMLVYVVVVVAVAGATSFYLGTVRELIVVAQLKKMTGLPVRVAEVDFLGGRRMGRALAEYILRKQEERASKKAAAARARNAYSASLVGPGAIEGRHKSTLVPTVPGSRAGDESGESQPAR